MRIVGPWCAFGLPLLTLRMASLIGGKAAQLQSFARQDAAYFGSLGIEKRSHGSTDIHVCAAVAHAHVERQIARIARNGKMRGVGHDVY